MCYKFSRGRALIHRVDDEYIDYDDYDFEDNPGASNNAAVDPYAGAHTSHTQANTLSAPVQASFSLRIDAKR